MGIGFIPAVHVIKIIKYNFVLVFAKEIISKSKKNIVVNSGRGKTGQPQIKALQDWLLSFRNFHFPKHLFQPGGRHFLQQHRAADHQSGAVRNAQNCVNAVQGVFQIVYGIFFQFIQIALYKIMFVIFQNSGTKAEIQPGIILAGQGDTVNRNGVIFQQILHKRQQYLLHDFQPLFSFISLELTGTPTTFSQMLSA